MDEDKNVKNAEENISTNRLPHADITEKDVLTIASGINVIIVNDNEAIIRYGVRSEPSVILRDTDSKNILGSLLSKLLEGNTTLHDLLFNSDKDIQKDSMNILSELLQRRIICKSSQNPIDQYLGYLLNKSSRLSDFKVSLIGMELIGAEIANDLVRSGLGSLILCHNIKTQHQNLKKVYEQKSDIDTIAKNLKDLGHSNIDVLEGEFDEYPMIEKAFSASDIVIVSLDRPNPRLYHRFNRIALQTERRWMIVSIDGHQGLIGPTFIPFHTACYGDFERQSEASLPTLETYRLYKQYLNQNNQRNPFIGLPSYAKILGGMTSMSIIHQLLRDYSFTTGRCLVIDFERMLIDTQDIFRLPRCPFCTRESLYSSSFPTYLENSQEEKHSHVNG